MNQKKTKTMCLRKIISKINYLNSTTKATPVKITLVLKPSNVVRGNEKLTTFSTK